MIKREVERARLRRSFEAMLSGAVDAFLAERGFERLGNDFDRHRGPLRDRINFQNNWHNGVTPWHGFFVNVGVGSAEVDAACPGHEHQLHPAPPKSRVIPVKVLLYMGWFHHGVGGLFLGLLLI